MTGRIYLDNSSTTMCYPEAAGLAADIMTTVYGNPSSKHVMGIEATERIETARRQLARASKTAEKEWIFTSGGTESINMAIRGCAESMIRSGKHIVTTSIEHPAVLQTVAALEERGWEVTRLGTDGRGIISLDELESAVRDDTVLVSIMAVNNEVGSVQPIAGAGRIIKAKNKNTLFFVDAVQAFGKIDIDPKKMNIDMFSVSGHKIHAPKGVGALYVRSGVRIKPLLFGGGQQGGMRSGTENVPGIAALGLACSMIFDDMQAKTGRMRALKERLAAGIRELGDAVIIGPEGMDGAPHILSAGFGGVKAEVLLHALESEGIFVSSGSACSSHHPGVSHVLSAMGTDKKYAESVIRFSLSEFNTEEEIDAAVAALAKLLPVLTRIGGRKR